MSFELDDQASALLGAPCVFCDYNGQGYWQAGTHARECPWFSLGGESDRHANLRGAIRLAIEERRPFTRLNAWCRSAKNLGVLLEPAEGDRWDASLCAVSENTLVLLDGRHGDGIVDALGGLSASISRPPNAKE